jgi:glycosyltransferase involved in cell wall biosynthesis
MTFNLLAVNPDLIHAHSYGYFQVNLSALMRWLKRVPFVITPHFHPLWSMWGGARRKYLRRFYDKLIAPGVLRAADRIVGVSQHEIELLKTACGKKLALSLEDKIRIIPNGIDLTRFCSQIPSISGEQFRALYGIEDYMVLYTGRLASNKGLQVLVAAAPIVLRAYPNTKFVLVGEDAGMKPQLVAKAKKLGVLDKFIFTGHIRDDDVFISAYKACDLFVLPSEYEAFGIVLLEAMAASKPCIATRVGGIPEALGDPDNNGAGILVDYGDARQLARAIIMLLSDADLRRKMGMCGRKRVQTRFSWQTIVARLEKEVYMELV